MKETWAIVPVKPFREGKSRLATELDEEQRWVLNRWLLEHTLQVLIENKQIDQTLITSRDSEVLAFARKHGAHTIHEDGISELNLAIERATHFVLQGYSESALILPTDLPLLDQETLQALFDHKQPSPSVIIVPDRHQKGTNALLVSPPGLIKYHFGIDSFKAHLMEASQNGNSVSIFNHPNLALDIDNPEDLHYLTKLNLPLPILEVLLNRNKVGLFIGPDPAGSRKNLDPNQTPHDFSEESSFGGTHD
jgi:2-phospho-L-lactate guanylyltransferase